VEGLRFRVLGFSGHVVCWCWNVGLDIYDEKMPDFPFVRIDHVQLAMPRGEEERARRFFVDVLRMTEIPKPPELAKRGGCWFASGDVQIHLGVEDDFRPVKKAHPALRCSNYPHLLARLTENGVAVIEASDIPGVRRSHISDPFGNRIELIAD
jgi:catechol 2,3-dioxygenase-like lactoylglutathione lyase family enzyme